MENVDRKILKAINKASPKSFISPVKVNEILKMDETEFGNQSNASEEIRACGYSHQRLSIEFVTTQCHIEGVPD